MGVRKSYLTNNADPFSKKIKLKTIARLLFSRLRRKAIRAQGFFIMAETTTPRLMAAAKEFNIGKDTLVDFLEGKGFSRDDLKPTSKLTEEMYRALQAGFQGDKVAKAKSDQIDLPKGAQQEARRKRDEEDLSFRKEERKVVKKEEPAPVPVVEVA